MIQKFQGAVTQIVNRFEEKFDCYSVFRLKLVMPKNYEPYRYPDIDGPFKEFIRNLPQKFRERYPDSQAHYIWGISGSTSQREYYLIGFASGIERDTLQNIAEVMNQLWGRTLFRQRFKDSFTYASLHSWCGGEPAVITLNKHSNEYAELVGRTIECLRHYGAIVTQGGSIGYKLV